MNTLFSPLPSISRHDLVGAIAERIEAHADAMGALIVLLDALEGDPDMEPTLGAPERHPAPSYWGLAFTITAQGDQTLWADGDNSVSADDCEVGNEDGGDILDGPELSDPIPGGSELRCGPVR